MSPKKKEDLLERESVVEKIDFAHQAVVAMEIGQNEADGFIDSQTGADATGAISRFSLMKFGHLSSVRYFAEKIANQAIRSRAFFNLLEDTAQRGETVFITSPGVFNVPSASNLLLLETTTLLNIICSKAGLPPIKLVEQIRLEESDFSYATKSVEARQSDSQGNSIIPEIFRGGTVVYLDDIYISGSVAERAKQRLVKEMGVRQTFFFFGLRIDQRLVLDSDGKIEDRLNRFVVDGSLEGLLPVISEPFIPTQKTLRDFLHPGNRARLADFLRTMKPETVYVLYSAAMQNGFRQRWGGIYRDSIDLTEEFLLQSGYLSWLIA